MKRIIDISDELFNIFKKHGIMAFDYFNEYDKDQIAIAIAHGIPYNPTSDFISREALKKCAIPCKIHNGALTDLCVPLYQIDNAPTVETFTLEDMQNNYDAGVDSVIGKYDKAKGEWVEFEYETSGGYKCSNCENIEVYTPNFCPNCGADMRGGAE